MSRGQRGFSALYLLLIVAVVAIIGFIGWKVVGSSTGSGSAGLVPIEGPETVRVDDKPEETNPDGVPKGYVGYTDAKLGFSFNYPEAWGKLEADGAPGAVLSLKTPNINGYSLADALVVKAVPIDQFRMPYGDKGTLIGPKPLGTSYEFIITDKGQDKAVTVGRTAAQQPPVIYRSGKAVVFNFPASTGNCRFDTWAFTSGANFVTLRLPSFCISDKPADADVQAGHKTDYDAQKQQILNSITVI